VFAQDMEEVIVLQPPSKGDGGTGTSIYDGSKLLQLAKFAASFSSGTAGWLSGIHGSIGAGFFTVGMVDPEPLTKTQAFGLGALYITSSGILHGASGFWGLLAADPPRKNYAVKLCTGSILAYKRYDLKEYQAGERFHAELDALVTSLRHFWDSVELWQGAAMAADKAWMQVHYDGAHKSYSKLYYISQRLPLLAEASYKELSAALDGNLAKIMAQTAKLQGRYFSDISQMVDVAKGLDANLPCQQGVADDMKKSFLTKKVLQVKPWMFAESVRRLAASAALLDKPS